EFRHFSWSWWEVRRIIAMASLTEDEFRLLAYLRGYADRCDQHLDPNWVQRQLGFCDSRMRSAANSLAKRGLVEFFDWRPIQTQLSFDPELGEGPFMCDICMTEHGWNYFRRQEI